MGKIALTGPVPPDDPMFSNGPELFSQPASGLRSKTSPTGTTGEIPASSSSATALPDMQNLPEDPAAVAIRAMEAAHPDIETSRIPVPTAFPKGCEFVASFSGDEFVLFPDGKVFKLADSGDELLEVGSLPMRGAPMSERSFLSCAEGCRRFNASKNSS